MEPKIVQPQNIQIQDHSQLDLPDSLRTIARTAGKFLLPLSAACVTSAEFEKARAHHQAEIEAIRSENSNLILNAKIQISEEIREAVPELLALIEQRRDRPFLEEQVSRILPASLQSMQDEIVVSLLDAIDHRRKVESDLDTAFEQRLKNLKNLSSELLEFTVLPVVQLAGENSIGSGVIVRQIPNPSDQTFSTDILTAWHVVRDIQGDPPDLSMPVPTQIYRADGTTRAEKFNLVAHDPFLDIALLRADLSGDTVSVAKLASTTHLELARIFYPVVATGCPIGNDPIPTIGTISALRHQVDGSNYWMINAPTYIGNSGGGIFDPTTFELMGIFSKIYTHGSLRPTIVPHMGLATPMKLVYGWLEEVGQGDLVPAEQRSLEQLVERTDIESSPK